MVSITPANDNEPDADGWIQVKGDDVQVKVCRYVVLVLIVSFKALLAFFCSEFSTQGVMRWGHLGKSYSDFQCCTV